MRLPAGFVIGLLALAAAVARPAAAQEALPGLGADLSRTTVSGLSSGAYMAGQFQLAFSASIIGAGIVAGGPYGCARTPGGDLNPFWPVVLAWNLSRAQNNCMEDGWIFSSVPDAEELASHAERLARDGRIDDIEGLKDDRIYVFSSRADDTVESGVVRAVPEFYRALGVSEANIEFVEHEKAAHAFLTEDAGLACGTKGAPFINDCDYDQAGAVLGRLYGELKPAGEAADGNFLRFDQRPFLEGLSDADFDATGMAYVPADCRSQPGCFVHVVFHGCRQGLAALGDQFVKTAGFARWAESNRLILLFPQVRSSTFNPNGCWDWWGYTGRNFLEREAPQMAAVKRMIDAVAAAP